MRQKPPALPFPTEVVAGDPTFDPHVRMHTLLPQHRIGYNVAPSLGKQQLKVGQLQWNSKRR